MTAVRSHSRRLGAIAALVLVAAACGNGATEVDDAGATSTEATGTTTAGSTAGTMSDSTEPAADTTEPAEDTTDTTADATEDSTVETMAETGMDLAAVKASVEARFEGIWGTPPTEGPPLVAGAKIMHISCGEALPSCSEPTQFVQAVGKLMGWQIDVRDANFSPPAAGDFIAEAIAGGYDAVTLEAIDCPAITAALQDAKAAGLPVVSFYAHDCATPSIGGESLMTETQVTDPWVNQASQDENWAASKADWLIDQLDGDVKVITMKQEDLFTPRHIGIGFDERIAECDTCEVVATIEFSFSDLLGQTLAQKVSEAILAHPEANSMHVLYDGLFLVGVNQGIVDAKGEGLVVAGGEFTKANPGFLDAGTEDLIMFYDHKWTAYATLDTVNRLLNNEAPVPQGLGWEAVDKDHPAEVEDGRFRSPTNYEAIYAASWGLG